MAENFEMVAKTFFGLEGVLAQELTALGAQDVKEGRRMVSFTGDNEMMYRANFCCRTALRILKPFCVFKSTSADDLYDKVRTCVHWEDFLTPDTTFAIDATVYSDIFRHSQFVTYRVKDAIADYFMDKYGKRPSIRIKSPDLQINVHIAEDQVTLSLDSSGEPLFKRGWRAAQTDAPINEVLAAGILMMAGWDGSQKCLVDPMCGSGTFLVEAALIATSTPPGLYREHFAFQNWRDYDADLFAEIYNDDSMEREFTGTIYGYDVLGKAIAISRENVKKARLDKYIKLERMDIADIEAAPESGGILVTNPPYGQRLVVDGLWDLYATLGTKLKHVFQGYDAWVIGYDSDTLSKIGLHPSGKTPLHNGSLECELRHYQIFSGTYASYRAEQRAEGKMVKGEKPERKQSDARGEKPRGRWPGRERDDAERGQQRKFGWSRRDGGERGGRPFGRKEFDRGQQRHAANDGGGVVTDEQGRQHSDEFDKRVVRFRQPRLGVDKERPIIHGRRQSWKRKDLPEEQ